MKALPRVVMIDDNAGDCIALEEALREAGERVAFTSFTDARQALAYLRGESSGGVTLPDLLILDLRMPGFSGLRALREIGADPSLRGIPIVVLSSSRRPEDQSACAAAGARAYLIKPYAWSQYPSLIALLAVHWRGKPPQAQLSSGHG